MRTKLALAGTLALALLLASSPSHADDERTTMPYIGVGIGGGVFTGKHSDVYDRGIGRGLIAGMLFGPAALELRLFERYQSSPNEEGLVGPTSVGNIEVTSASVAYSLTGSAPLIWVEVGAALVSTPVLTIRGPGVFETEQMSGIGPLAGLSLRWPVGHFTVGIDVRGVVARQGLPERPYVTITGVDSMGVSYTDTSDYSRSVLITGSVSLRVLLF